MLLEIEEEEDEDCLESFTPSNIYTISSSSVKIKKLSNVTDIF